MHLSKTLKILLSVCAILFGLIFMLGHARPYGVNGAVEAERVYDVAVQSNNISICDEVHLNGFADVTNRELRQVCYEEYATAHPDQNVCSRIDNDFRCVSANAISANNPSVCLVIEDSNYRSLCVSYVAASKHNVTLCNELLVPLDQQQCKEYFIRNNIHK